MHPPTPCFPENPIPPEAPIDSWIPRFAETDENGVVWYPDLCPPEHLQREESILLDKRGLIRHPAPTSNSSPQKTEQREFWREQTAYKNSIAAKLREVGMHEDAASLENCHSYYTVAVCGDCGQVRRFPNRCDQFFCPECNHHLTADRTSQVEWWVKTIRQPKHVCLTIKNVPDITPLHIDELRGFFTKLRHRRFARNWKGGFYSLQVTHNKKGWHLHIHAVVEAQWIDHAGLNDAWASITRGAGKITAVRDCRAKGYLRKVTGYVARGSDLSKWPAQTIAECINAFRGRRTFGVFGCLFGMRAEFAEWIAELKAKHPRCDCGSCNVKYFSETEYIAWDLRPGPTPSPRPPPMTETQKEMVLGGPAWPD
jgi:hypothetical protein